jgi:hypothetical protein
VGLGQALSNKRRDDAIDERNVVNLFIQGRAAAVWRMETRTDAFRSYQPDSACIRNVCKFVDLHFSSAPKAMHEDDEWQWLRMRT